MVECATITGYSNAQKTKIKIMADAKKKMFIDVKKAVEVYNEANPETPIDRKKLAEKLDLSYQSLVNYQGGSIPDLARVLKEIINLTGISFCELVKEKK